MPRGALCFILCSHLHTPHASDSASFPMLLFRRMIACAITTMTMVMMMPAGLDEWMEMEMGVCQAHPPATCH
jgi:hypothetical protein